MPRSLLPLVERSARGELRSPDGQGCPSPHENGP
jgi:hypothetical protein